MKQFKVTGFTQHGVWAEITVRTIRGLVEERAKVNGIVEITDIREL